jgi:hypothetical protein
VYILPEDGHRSGPKHVVVVHNKIEHKKYLLRMVVLIKVLVVRRFSRLQDEDDLCDFPLCREVPFEQDSIE